jgi:hypothetical protein
MKNLIRVLSVFLALTATASIAAAAESKAVQSLAGVLTGLQHTPSAEAKATLGQIAEDKASTADEKTIAKALGNVNHKVAAGDKAALEAIVADAKATAGAKTLAGVILSLNHFPSADDKTKLAALSK